MATAKLTLYGMSKYCEKMKLGLYDGMTVPDGIDKETLVNNIILRGADFEVMYPDPEFMKEMISMWAKKHSWTFSHWMTAIEQVDNFNPLENYDRTEEWTNTSDGKSNSEDTVKVTAYDSDDLHTKSNDSTTGTASNVGTTKGRAHGNIGVTSLSDLFIGYMDNTAVWNVYEHITDLFLQEFTIPVY